MVGIGYARYVSKVNCFWTGRAVVQVKSTLTLRTRAASPLQLILLIRALAARGLAGPSTCSTFVRTKISGGDEGLESGSVDGTRVAT